MSAITRMKIIEMRTEIEQLRETIAAQAADIRTLEIEFGDVRDSFLLYKAKTQAQAAVIESLRNGLLDVCTEVESADMLLSHGDTKGALAGVRSAHVAASLGFSLLKRTNDSTQILDEVL